MKHLGCIRHSEKYREMPPSPAPATDRPFTE